MYLRFWTQSCFPADEGIFKDHKFYCHADASLPGLGVWVIEVRFFLSDSEMQEEDRSGPLWISASHVYVWEP